MLKGIFLIILFIVPLLINLTLGLHNFRIQDIIFINITIKTEKITQKICWGVNRYERKRLEN
jgi:hypothetical protein